MELALQYLPKQGNSKQLGHHWLELLSKPYTGIMKKLQSQLLGFWDLARRVLLWVILAKRPLKADELRYALAVEIGDTNLDPRNIRDINMILCVCGGLVILDKSSGIVRTATWVENPHREIAQTCITYLSFRSFRSPTAVAEIEKHPFYNYAALHWGYHSRKGHVIRGPLCLCFLRSRWKLSSSFYKLGAVAT